MAESTNLENSGYFTESGECLDEVTFVFDDDKKLYVSQNFLHYVSPVFKAMFEHGFREQETKTVKLTGKNYDDFLEFLLCLHPNTQNVVGAISQTGQEGRRCVTALINAYKKIKKEGIPVLRAFLWSLKIHLGTVLGKVDPETDVMGKFSLFEQFEEE